MEAFSDIYSTIVLFNKGLIYSDSALAGVLNAAAFIHILDFARAETFLQKHFSTNGLLEKALSCHYTSNKEFFNLILRLFYQPIEGSAGSGGSEM